MPLNNLVAVWWQLAAPVFVYLLMHFHGHDQYFPVHQYLMHSSAEITHQ
jgi:hypothetical protein